MFNKWVLGNLTVTLARHNFATVSEINKQVNCYFERSWSLKMLVLPRTKINTP